MPVTANRYHDISCGHRVVGHEGKCRFLHGHNYRIHFSIQAESLDEIGRVLDFGAIKTNLCMWLEENWDHKFLVWNEDDIVQDIFAQYSDGLEPMPFELYESFVFVPFNPTAENMAEYLTKVIGPLQLEGTGCTLVKTIIEETRKCSVTYYKEQ